MKVFTTFIKRIKESPRGMFIAQIAGFYVLLMAIYLYLMLGNLSTAAPFIYSQF